MRKQSSFVILALLGAGLSGCSSDVMRFGDPFSNPFTSSSNRQASRGDTFRQQPFPKTEKMRSATDDIVTGSTRKVQEVKQLPYNENVQRAWEGRGAIKSAVKLPPKLTQMQMKTASSGGWSPIGGTTIQARSGDTVKALSDRYGVPASAIAMANGVETTATLKSGASVVIPTYSMNRATVAKKEAVITPEKTSGITGLKSQKSDTKVARDVLVKKELVKKTEPRYAKSEPRYAKSKREHIIAPGDSLGSLANRYKVKREDLANANKIGEWDQLKIGKALVVPAAVATTAVAIAKPVVKPQLVAVKPLKTDTMTTASIAKPKQVSATKAIQEKPAQLTPATAATELDFRWPLRSARAISNYGDDLNGANNEGVNFSAPEGTEIRAAEDGEIAFASNGKADPNLKNYGNLILIRHADRYVTAYAHTKDVQVKVGDKVKRGQVIGRVGQTGSVSSPQLHFEIRQGKNSIDPEKLIKS